MIVDGVLCSRPGSWGSRTGSHIIRDDGSREFCPTCDYQPLALARVARRSWWRRLLDALPRRRRALAPAVEICACGMPIDATGACWPCRWEANALDGRPPPTAPPRDPLDRAVDPLVELRTMRLRGTRSRRPPPATSLPPPAKPSPR